MLGYDGIDIGISKERGRTVDDNPECYISESLGCGGMFVDNTFV